MECDKDFIVFEEKVVLYKNLPLLDEMRREGKFCDVTLKVKGLSFKAHKIILSATIPYFHSMFSSNMVESEMSEVTLQEIEAESLEALLNFSYTGRIVIDITTVQSIMFGASYLQLTNLLSVCEGFLCNRLEMCKVIETWRFATMLSCKALVNACEQFMHKYFNGVSSCDEFLDLTAEELGSLLSSNQLNVPKEEFVFEALMRWIKKDLKTRKAHLLNLLPKVRLQLISPEYLITTVANEELIKSSHKCRNLIDEAKDYHLVPGKCEIKSFYSEPRHCQSLGGFILAVGGMKSTLVSEAAKTVELFNPLTGKWSLTTPMIKGRARVSVAVMNKFLYAIGGDTNSKMLNNVERFDFITKQWSEISPLQRNRSAAGAAVLGDAVYVCGGFDGYCSLSSVEYYRKESRTWKFAESMITRRSSCGVVALDGYLYALGGHDDKTVLDLVERYDPLTKKWTQVAPMLSQRCRLGAASFNGKLYVCGGYNGYSFLETVEMYDPKVNMWRMIAPMKTKRSRVALTVNMGGLWAIGGYNGKSVLSTVEIYNPFFDKWTFGPAMHESGGDVGVGVMHYS